MSIEKFKIQRTGDDMYLKLNLGSDDAFAGAQQEIDNITETASIELINPLIDKEKRRFKLNTSISTLTYQFYFYNALAIPQHGTFFPLAGFTLNEVSGLSNVFINSFFILDYYNTYDPNTQTKIATTYLTKLGNNKPIYNVSANTNQFYYWYIPQSYIDIQTGSTATGYTKFSFYNAKTGKIQPFYNVNNVLLTTPEKSYFKTELNVVNRTWKFLNVTYPNVNVYEMENNVNYANRLNSTFTSFSGVTQNYPSGETYYYTNNTYTL